MEFDLHTHSWHSFDSRSDPRKIVAAARRAGLRGIAVTDHSTCAGAHEAMKYADDECFVIPGFEKWTTAGDIIGLFVDECPKSNDPLEVCRSIHDQGGLAILPHPFTSHLSVPIDLVKELDGIEGFNARHASVRKLRDPRGEERIVKFAEAHDLTLVAASDADGLAEIGGARTVLPASTPEEVKEALQKGTTALVGRRTPRPYVWLAYWRGLPHKIVRRLFPSEDEPKHKYDA